MDALLRFYDDHEQGQNPAPDWEGSWSKPVVDEAGWVALRGELQSTYERVAARLTPESAWPELQVGAALFLLAHCAYHVGQVRPVVTLMSAT